MPIYRGDCGLRVVLFDTPTDVVEHVQHVIQRDDGRITTQPVELVDGTSVQFDVPADASAMYWVCHLPDDKLYYSPVVFCWESIEGR